MLSPTKKLRVLYIPLEFRDYFCASRWAYPANFGLEEGFEAAGVQLTTLPAYYSQKGFVHSPGGWLHHAQTVLAGMQFDQVWVEIAQSHYSPYFLEWLSTLAPVRVGLIFESFSPDLREFVNNPRVLALRTNNIIQNISFMTHLLVSDETDFDRLREEGTKPVFWWNCGKIPRRCVATRSAEPNADPGLFYGTVYDIRKRFFETPFLRKLLLHKTKSLEQFTGFPKLYEEIQDAVAFELKDATAVSMEQLQHYLSLHRYLRRRLFDVWLDSLAPGCAVVNLPQHGRVYAGRVTEGMAVGKPVISWKIPNSPKAGLMFEENKEILLFDQDKASELADHIKHVQQDFEFARAIGEAGRRKLLEHHTIETFVQHMLYWIDTGKDLNAGDLVERAASLEVVSKEHAYNRTLLDDARSPGRGIRTVERLQHFLPQREVEQLVSLLTFLRVKCKLTATDESISAIETRVGGGVGADRNVLADIDSLSQIPSISAEGLLWDACLASEIKIHPANLRNCWRTIVESKSLEDLVWRLEQAPKETGLETQLLEVQEASTLVARIAKNGNSSRELRKPQPQVRVLTHRESELQTTNLDSLKGGA